MKIILVGKAAAGKDYFRARLAKKGFRVHGIERKKEILNFLKIKQGHFYEPGLNKTIKQIIANKKFTFSNKIKNSKETYILAVPSNISVKKLFTIKTSLKNLNVKITQQTEEWEKAFNQNLLQKEFKQ